MRLTEALLVAAIAVSLGACVPGQPKTAKAAPAPKPAPAPAPPPPAPLSVPQTNVELPPRQPVPLEALETADAPAEPAAPAAVNKPGNTGSRSTRRPTAEKPAEPVAPPPPETATAPAPEPQRPLVSEALPAAELKRLQDEAHGRKQEIVQLLARIPRGRIRQQKATVDRINSFLQQGDDAERRGDMRQASELAGRALVLARELK